MPQPLDLIDTTDQAYLLGRVAGGGTEGALPEAARARLDLAPDGRATRFPDWGRDALRLAFLRGLFDESAEVAEPSETQREPWCRLPVASAAFGSRVADAVGTPPARADGALVWQGNAALDVLAALYDGDDRLPRARARDAYRAWCGSVPFGRAMPPFRWSKTRPDAVAPSKSRASDSGFDLVLLEAVKRMGDVTLYDTGIQVQPAFGWYFDVVPRSSISKTGYALANSVGVIDRTYTGPILVALRKADPDAPDLPLPSRLVQMIPRPIVHVRMEAVESLDETERGAGGFGSTGTR